MGSRSRNITGVNAVTAVLTVVAVARLTRLVAVDYLTEPVRRWAQARVPERVAYLLGCSWCASIWVGFPVAWVVVAHQDQMAVMVVLLALAGSQVAGQLAGWEPSEDVGELIVTVEDQTTIEDQVTIVDGPDQ